MRSIFFVISALMIAGCDVKTSAPIETKPSQTAQEKSKKPISKLEEERQRNMELANSSPVEQQQKQVVIKDSELNSQAQIEKNRLEAEAADELKKQKAAKPIAQEPKELDQTPANCKNINAMSMSLAEMISQTLNVSIRSVEFLRGEYGTGPYGSCAVVVDTPVGIRRCSYLWILEGSQGKLIAATMRGGGVVPCTK
jgi:hypothetical protein